MIHSRLGKRMLIWIRAKGVRPCECLNAPVKDLCVGGGVFPRILIFSTIPRCGRCGHIYASTLFSSRKAAPVHLDTLEKKIIP